MCNVCCASCVHDSLKRAIWTQTWMCTHIKKHECFRTRVKSMLSPGTELSPPSIMAAWEGMTPKVGRQPKSGWPSYRNLHENISVTELWKVTLSLKRWLQNLRFVCLHGFKCVFSMQAIERPLRPVKLISTNIYRYTPQMVRVLGGHAHPQCIENTLGVGEVESGSWQFLSHCHSLRGEKRILESTVSVSST